jgi:type IV pilus biogenesis protein CpaD/CtpE
VTASLRIRVSIAAALAQLLAACAAPSPQADARFGQSVRATIASQVAQPAAVRNANPVDGIDGRAARAAQEHYERSFGQAQGGSVPAPLVMSR